MLLGILIAPVDFLLVLFVLQFILSVTFIEFLSVIVLDIFVSFLFPVSMCVPSTH